MHTCCQQGCHHLVGHKHCCKAEDQNLICMPCRYTEAEGVAPVQSDTKATIKHYRNGWQAWAAEHKEAVEAKLAEDFDYKVRVYDRIRVSLHCPARYLPGSGTGVEGQAGGG